MYRVIFWIQAKVYKLMPDGQFSGEIVAQTENVPITVEGNDIAEISRIAQQQMDSIIQKVPKE